MSANAAWHADFGPLDGPIPARAQPPALGVHARPDASDPAVGIAYPIGIVLYGTRAVPAKTFRLVVGGEELEGRWLCVGRRFVKLGEAAEEV